MSASSLDEETMFRIASEISSPDARKEYLQHACGNDKILHDRMLILLRAGEESSFLESPPPGIASTTFASPLTEKPGGQIGPYKLREQIGEGGFGVVFVAEQTAPVRRKVALKVIKPGMDTKEVIARFEAERQALALVDHPNIARVLDAGTTATGRPYFAMELVKGVPITEFCDSQELTTKERLRLLVDVCLAVQHAHQKGIIHRDIKPSNVMVTMHDDRPVAKVIDFGVAKAIGRSLTEKTIYTAYGQMVGTPMYMSPEQAQLSGLDVDTRSDVYSLGVLAYELLTGGPPFDKETLGNVGFDEMRRIILEDEPRRPSIQVSTLQAERLSTISDQRKIDPRRLSKSLQGELDWVVMKALEKDRARRYQTAASLADDVKRYLIGDAVLACPPTMVYRVGKFVQRNRFGIVVAVAMVALLLGGIAATTWQAVRATIAMNRAVKAERLAAQRLKESEAARNDAQITLNFFSDLIKKPRTQTPVRGTDGSQRPLRLADLQDEIVKRKELKLDIDELAKVYEFAKSSQNFVSIESAVKARVLEQAHGLVKGKKIDRQKFSQLIYLARRVAMEQMLEDTFRPAFANTVEKIVTAILQGRKVNNDDFNGVRELTESASGLVNESLQMQLRPVFKRAVAKMVSVPMNDFNKGSRFAANRLFQVGKYIELKEVLPLALKVSAAEGWSVKARRDAVNLVGMYGKKEQVETLEKLLGDRTQIYEFGQISSNGVGFTSCLGDEALAAMIHLSGGDLAEYGFAQPENPNPQYRDRELGTWGFYGNSKEEIEKTRQQAITKWKTLTSEGL